MEGREVWYVRLARYGRKGVTQTETKLCGLISTHQFHHFKQNSLAEVGIQMPMEYGNLQPYILPTDAGQLKAFS